MRRILRETAVLFAGPRRTQQSVAFVIHIPMPADNGG